MRERRSTEFNGKNVEEAISRGLSELNLERDDVEVHIITPGNRGVLGIGAEDARVALSYFTEVQEPAVSKRREEAPAQVEPVAAFAADEAVHAVEDTGDEEQADEEFAVPPDYVVSDAERLAIEIVGHLLGDMGIKAEVVALPPQGLMAEQSGDGPSILLDIRGDDLGILIGRRGESLMALQYITRLIVSHKLKTWLNIILDVEQYRVRRERSLRQLALRMADRVAATHQPVPLEAMTPYERRVIHLTLHDHAHVTTKSIGEGENRKVVIIPVDSSKRA